MANTVTNDIEIGTFKIGITSYDTARVDVVVDATLSESLSTIEHRKLSAIKLVARGKTVIEMRPEQAESLVEALSTALQVADYDEATVSSPEPRRILGAMR